METSTTIREASNNTATANADHTVETSRLYGLNDALNLFVENKGEVVLVLHQRTMKSAKDFAASVSLCLVNGMNANGLANESVVPPATDRPHHSLVTSPLASLTDDDIVVALGDIGKEISLLSKGYILQDWESLFFQETRKKWSALYGIIQSVQCYV